MKCTTFLFAALFCVALASRAFAGEGGDILINDFEGPDWGDWKTEGEAFGPRPAQGAWEKQGVVSGFDGKGLANSFYRGDAATGKLISPEFTVAHKYLVFRVGGSDRPFNFTSDADYVGVHLVHKGSTIRNSPTAMMKAKHGVSDELRKDYFDVSDYLGEKVHLEIVDNSHGGHILADTFYQTDKKPVPEAEYVERRLVLDKRWLNFPINKNAPFREMKVFVDGKMIMAHMVPFDLKNPQMWVPVDLTPHLGQKAMLQIEKLDGVEATSEAIANVLVPSDKMTDGTKIYNEPIRPRFHYTPRYGQATDSNGLVYYDGEYHLGYQTLPFDCMPPEMHGNWTWGQAVGRDLVHWEELPLCFWPDRDGAQWSGSAVADTNNTAGFETGRESPLVAFYTASAACAPWMPSGKTATINLAFSNDRGRTWTKYKGNPIIPNIDRDNRDPKVLWYEPGKHWVMILYIHANVCHVLTSKDLKHWEKRSEIHGFHECPDLFELPVNGDEKNKKWVFFGANCNYVIGSFDGAKFTPQTGTMGFAHTDGSYYASQVFNDVPNGRKVWIARAGVYDFGLPVGMLTFPLDLTLRTIDGGNIEMCKYPVPEIKKLYQQSHLIPRGQKLVPGQPLRPQVKGRAFDIDAEIIPAGAKAFNLHVFGRDIVFDLQNMQMRFFESQEGHQITAPLVLVNGKLQIRILVDTIFIEVFSADGRFYSPVRCTFPLDDDSFEFSVQGGDVVMDKLDIHELKSIWTTGP